MNRPRFCRVLKLVLTGQLGGQSEIPNLSMILSKGLATEDRKRKINEAKAQRQAAREARIAASRARLGAREGGLEARPAGSTCCWGSN